MSDESGVVQFLPFAKTDRFWAIPRCARIWDALCGGMPLEIRSNAPAMVDDLTCSAKSQGVRLRKAFLQFTSRYKVTGSSEREEEIGVGGDRIAYVALDTCPNGMDRVTVRKPLGDLENCLHSRTILSSCILR